MAIICASSERGQAMVEAMVALAVIVAGILGVFTLTSQSLSLNRVDADRFVAVNLASEGIELVKNLVDKNIMNEAAPWNLLQGFAADGDYEMDYNDAGLSQYSDGDFLYFNPDGSGYYRYQQAEFPLDKQTSFRRKLSITRTAERIGVVSTIYWSSRGASYSFSVQDYFYNLKTFKQNLNNQLNG